jgi:hypothetical protein
MGNRSEGLIRKEEELEDRPVARHIFFGGGGGLVTKTSPEQSQKYDGNCVGIFN